MLISIVKLGTSQEIDFDSLPQASKDYIIAYGLKQALNDCYAGVTDKAEIEAKFKTRLEKILNGTMGIVTRSAGLSQLDSIAFRIAKAKVQAAAKAKALTLTKEQIEAAAKTFMAKPEIQALAKAELNLKAEALAIELDI